MKWLFRSCALTLIGFGPVLVEAQWSVGVGVSSSPYWSVGYHDYHYSRHDPFYDPFYGSRYDRWHRRGHFDPWFHDPWHYRSGASWHYTSPFIRNRDRWTDRAVPHSTAVTIEQTPPTPSERAQTAFDNPSTREVAPEDIDEESSTSIDGAALAGQGIAALARKDYATAVSALRLAFSEDPRTAARAAESESFRATCNELKERLLYQHPYTLSVDDSQFLRAVLFLYTGDYPSADYAAQTIRDDARSTARLQDLTRQL